jgi:hypothetical protein
MHKIDYTVSTYIDNKVIDDILSTAFEGGITYWSSQGVKVKNWPKGADYASDVISRGEPVYIYVDDNNAWAKLTLPDMIDGIRWFLSQFGRTPDYFSNGEFDANDADIIVQHALFGGLIYG